MKKRRISAKKRELLSETRRESQKLADLARKTEKKAQNATKNDEITLDFTIPPKGNTVSVYEDITYDRGVDWDRVEFAKYAEAKGWIDDEEVWFEGTGSLEDAMVSTKSHRLMGEERHYLRNPVGHFLHYPWFRPWISGAWIKRWMIERSDALLIRRRGGALYPDEWEDAGQMMADMLANKPDLDL